MFTEDFVNDSEREKDKIITDLKEKIKKLEREILFYKKNSNTVENLNYNLFEEKRDININD